MKHWCLVIFCLFYSTNSFAQVSKNYNLDNGLAIQGYDPVAYFKNKPTEGKKEYASQYQGVTYYFASLANKQAFIENPKKYEPVYGGWCAFAMGDTGKKVEINPETFKIVDGKLHLFYNAFFNNTLKSWNKNEKNLKQKADLNWTKINK